MTERLEQLVKILEDDSHNSFVIYAIAKEYEKAGHPLVAETYYRKLKELDPSYIGLYYHLGKLYEALGRIELALETYEDGIFMAQKLGDQHSLAELKSAHTNLEMMI